MESEMPLPKMTVDEYISRRVDELLKERLAEVDRHYSVPAGSVLVLRTSRIVLDSEKNAGPFDPVPPKDSYMKLLSAGKARVVSLYDQDFEWPTEPGSVVSCSDFDPNPHCGQGLHGLMWGVGDHGYFSRQEFAVWQVLEVEESNLVNVNDHKVKFSSGKLLYTGDLSGASKFLSEHSPVPQEDVDAIRAATKLDRALYNSEFVTDGSEDYEDAPYPIEVGLGPFSNLIGSRLAESSYHAPALDMDVPCRIIPSSTPGHGHLFIDVPMSWRKYKKLLKVMGECGILEKGFVRASIARGGTFLRLPWVKKPF